MPSGRSLSTVILVVLGLVVALTAGLEAVNGLTLGGTLPHLVGDEQRVAAGGRDHDHGPGGRVPRCEGLMTAQIVHVVVRREEQGVEALGLHSLGGTRVTSLVLGSTEVWVHGTPPGMASARPV